MSLDIQSGFEENKSKLVKKDEINTNNKKVNM